MKQTKLISLSTCILAVAPLQTGHGAHPDFDNDGSADLVTWRTIDGFFYIRSSSGNCPKIATPFFSGCASQWGNPWLGDKPALGDFAGDGHTGMAVYRESDLSWHVRVSWGGQFLGIYMGVSNGTPVVGDYSGDGRSDLALYDSANASWHIRDSTTLRIRVHGNPISRPPTVKKVIPLPADYDADGRFDVGIVSVTLGNDFQWNYRSSRSNRVETMAIRGTANCIPVGTIENCPSNASPYGLEFSAFRCDRNLGHYGVRISSGGTGKCVTLPVPPPRRWCARRASVCPPPIHRRGRAPRAGGGLGSIVSCYLVRGILHHRY